MDVPVGGGFATQSTRHWVHLAEKSWLNTAIRRVKQGSSLKKWWLFDPPSKSTGKGASRLLSTRPTALSDHGPTFTQLATILNPGQAGAVGGTLGSAVRSRSRRDGNNRGGAGITASDWPYVGVPRIMTVITGSLGQLAGRG